MKKITNVIGEFSKECPYVVITGKGNYTETIYRNFHILPADVSDATLKYTDQFEAKAGKTAKIISSFKYKKALKEGSDYAISVPQKDTNGTGTPVALTQRKLPLNAGNYELVIMGTGNYTGTNGYVGSKSVTFKITGRALTQNKVNLTAKADKTNPAARELTYGEDYTITYKNNKAATKENTNSTVKVGSKQPVMTIKGKGNYAGTLTVQFQIIPASIDHTGLCGFSWQSGHGGSRDACSA